MTDKFNEFAVAVQSQITKMFETGVVFTLDVSKDILWETYLNSFPSGTNPIFRERRVYDCNCCKQFIRTIGALATFNERGQQMTIWDEVTGSFFDEVCAEMRSLLLNKPIKSEWRHDSPIVGTRENFELLPNGESKKWEHLWCEVPREFVISRGEYGPFFNESNVDRQLLMHALKIFDLDVLDDVIDMCRERAILRGPENVEKLKTLREVLGALVESGVNPEGPEVWLAASMNTRPVCRVINSSIGTLIKDMSEGISDEKAILRYEQKVSGPNYQVTKRKATPRQIEKAKEAVTEMGYMSAMGRRYATLRDVPPNEMLFVDRSVASKMKDPFDMLKESVGDPVKINTNITKVGLNRFLASILPNSDSVEVLVNNAYKANFVSLIAPMDSNCKNPFYWNNSMSWAYAGDTTDVTKGLVAKAGGNVTGYLRCSGRWFNGDDQDFHLRIKPANRRQGNIHIGYRGSGYGKGNPDLSTGGCLDVDMNAGCAHNTKNPVENITFPDACRLPDGEYEFSCHMFQKRNYGASSKSGFVAEIEIGDELFNFTYDKDLNGKETVVIAKFRIKDGKLTALLSKHGGSNKRPEKVWGIMTEKFHPVELVCLSPNYWGDSAVGHEHLFFFIKGCKRPGEARGLYNEFLKPELREHRRTLQMLGDLVKAPASGEQVSGVGFSTSRRDTFTVRITRNGQQSIFEVVL